MGNYKKKFTKTQHFIEMFFFNAEVELHYFMNKSIHK